MFFFCFVCAGMWLGISLAVFGFSLHEFYFFHILPVLFQEQTLCETGNVSITAQFCSSSFFTSFLKLLFIIATLGISMFVTKTTIKNFAQESLLFSFVLCLPLILMKNVWGNYQIVLLIPIAVLLAYSFEKKGLINYLPGIIALLAWLPLIASDNYPAMNIPYYFLIDGKIARTMIDHLKAYSAMVLWAELAYLLIKQKMDKN